MTGSGDDRDDVWEPFREAADGDGEDDGSVRDQGDRPSGDDDSGGTTPPTDRGESTDDPGRGDSDFTTASDPGAGGPDRTSVVDDDGGDDSDRTSADDDSGAEDSDPPPAGGDRGGDPPSPEPAAEEESYDNPIVWFFETDSEEVVAIREVASTVGIVVLLGVVLFGTSGLWPPLVAIESGSMEPHMFKGDLVFVVENGRFAPEGSNAGVVTYRQGNPEYAPGDGATTGYWSFGSHGNVIVFEPDGRDGTPIIHRAHFYVEEGENWYDEANPQYVAGAENCEELRACPAPHDGFITKGDNNPYYDQVRGRSTVVRPEWVRGVAKVRVPWLGCIRLQLSGNSCF